MRNYRKGLLGFGAALFAFGLASCGAEEVDTTTTTTTTTTEKTPEPEAPAAETKDDYKIKVASPKGAPGMSLATLKTTKASTYDVTWVDNPGTALAPTSEYDAVIAPVNAGAKLYAKNGTFQMAAVVTWGNLYFASQTDITAPGFKFEADNTFLFGKGSIPGAVASYVLKNETDSVTVTDANYTDTVGSETVTFSTAADTAGQLAKPVNASKVYLVAEPTLTKISSVKTIYSISVSEMYEALNPGESNFPQAALFVKKTTAEAHKSVVDAFIADVKASCDNVATNAETVAQYGIDLQLLALDKTILTTALPKCAISFVKASDTKTKIAKEVAALSTIDATVFGGGAPADGFYYA